MRTCSHIENRNWWNIENMLPTLPQCTNTLEAKSVSTYEDIKHDLNPTGLFQFSKAPDENGTISENTSGLGSTT